MNKLVEKTFHGEVLPPQQLLQELKERLHQKIEEGSRLIRDFQLECGKILLEMRTLVESGKAGDISWWKWFDANIPDLSQDHAQRWIRIASSDDPEAAALEFRQHDAERHRIHRERKKLAAPDVRVTSHGNEPDVRLTSVETEPEPQPKEEPVSPSPAQSPLQRWEAAQEASYDTGFEISQLSARMFALAATLRPMARQEFAKARHEDLAAFERKFAPTDTVGDEAKPDDAASGVLSLYWQLDPTHQDKVLNAIVEENEADD
jgi:hypothetical protein